MMRFKNRQGSIYYFCPDLDFPIGGIKKIYQHVDLLNALGLPAFVAHKTPKFRCSWFHNTTPIIYMRSLKEPLMVFNANGEQKSLPPFSPDDVLVVSEVMAEKIVQRVTNAGLYSVIFSQNAYYTFMKAPQPQDFFNEADRNRPVAYYNKNLLGVIVVSEDSKKYLEHAFTSVDISRIHISCNLNIFSYQNNKKKQIAYFPRKCKEDSLQIISILKQRGILKDWTLAPLHFMKEEDVAKVLRESAIFLSFSFEEGWGMPPMEAMLCGCVVIGYHGGGGKEYFRGDTVFPITTGDILNYAKTVEKIALDYEVNQTYYSEKTRSMSNYIQNKYSTEREKQDLAKTWNKILKKHEAILKIRKIDDQRKHEANQKNNQDVENRTRALGRGLYTPRFKWLPEPDHSNCDDRN